MLALTLAIAQALADFPERSISFVVPFPAGGTADIVARIVAHELQAEYGKGVVIENRGGASTAIGTVAAWR
jgi:tripartite-type tricarboxylate transporter receptor subunit TctC